jgi:hypothetical protein
VFFNQGSRSALKLLKSDEAFYQRFAEQWSRENNLGTFCYFYDGHYRWNKTFITQQGSAFEVEENGVRSRASNLVEAASAAGVAADRLTEWIAKAKQGHVYCVKSEPPDSQTPEKYVELLLEGSAFDPHGLRYAPEGRPEAFERLVHDAKQNGTNMDYRMEHLDGRWFYFVGRR